MAKITKGYERKCADCERLNKKVRFAGVVVEYGLTPLCYEHLNRRTWPATAAYATV